MPNSPTLNPMAGMDATEIRAPRLDEGADSLSNWAARPDAIGALSRLILQMRPGLQQASQASMPGGGRYVPPGGGKNVDPGGSQGPSGASRRLTGTALDEFLQHLHANQNRFLAEAYGKRERPTPPVHPEMQRQFRQSAEGQGDYLYDSQRAQNSGMAGGDVAHTLAMHGYDPRVSLPWGPGMPRFANSLSRREVGRRRAPEFTVSTDRPEVEGPAPVMGLKYDAFHGLSPTAIDFFLRERLGASLHGITEGPKGSPGGKAVWYHDPRTGSTGLVREDDLSAESLRRALNEMRARFGQQ